MRHEMHVDATSPTPGTCNSPKFSAQDPPPYESVLQDHGTNNFFAPATVNKEFEIEVRGEGQDRGTLGGRWGPVSRATGTAH